MSPAFEEQDAAQVLESLVRTPSVSTDETRAAEWFANALSDRGFDAHIDAAGNPTGVIGEGEALIALVGHIDTVPGEVEVRIEDGKLYGRGSVDAKGPLVALAAGARRAVDAGANARFVLVGCVEEEAPSSKGARHLLESWTRTPDALVVGEPSGWSGVTLGYKGYLRADVRVTTPAAHGAHEAPSAPELAAETWIAIRDAARAFAGPDAKLFDSLLPRLLDIRGNHDGLLDESTLALALRLPLELQPDQAAHWIREVALHANEVRTLGEAPAWRGPRTSSVARAFGRAILEKDVRPRYQVKTGTADLNLLAPAWGCPSIAYGPGDAALDHTPNEHICLAEFERGIEVAARALRSLVM